MKIPTSMLVMSVVTAVPFGLAIRDNGERRIDQANPFERSRARTVSEEDQAIELSNALEQQTLTEPDLRIIRRVMKDPSDLGLFGQAPASLGSLFGGSELGAVTSEPVFEAIGDADNDAFRIHVMQSNGEHTSGLRIEILQECDAVQQRLEQTWGRSPDSIWVDPAKHQRASFDSVACALTIEQYATPDAWFAKTGPAVVSLDQLDPSSRDNQGEDEAAYVRSLYGLGLGRGRGPTIMRSYVNHGAVTGLDVSVDTDRETAEAVRLRLTNLLGPPKYDATYGYSDWSGKLPIHFEMTSTHLLLTIGKRPQ